MSPEMIAIVGTLGGVLLTSLFNLVNNWMSKQSEERTKTRELVINAAIEHWSVHNAQMVKLREQTPGSTATIYPLDLFIPYMAKVCDVALKPNVSRAELSSKFREAGEMLDELIAERTREDKERKLKRRETR